MPCEAGTGARPNSPRLSLFSTSRTSPRSRSPTLRYPTRTWPAATKLPSSLPPRTPTTPAPTAIWVVREDVARNLVQARINCVRCDFTYPELPLAKRRRERKLAVTLKKKRRTPRPYFMRPLSTKLRSVKPPATPSPLSWRSCTSHPGMSFSEALPV